MSKFSMKIIWLEDKINQARHTLEVFEQEKRLLELKERKKELAPYRTRNAKRRYDYHKKKYTVPTMTIRQRNRIRFKRFNKLTK